MKVIMKIGIKIRTDFKPHEATPRNNDDNKVNTQPINLNKVTITINGALPTLINSRILEPKEGWPSVSAAASTSVTSPK